MEPQTKKPVSVPDNSNFSFRKKTLNGTFLMIMDNLALRIKKGLPASSPRPDTEIKIFTVEGFIYRQEASKLKKHLFPTSHRASRSVKTLYHMALTAQTLNLLQIPFASPHFTSDNIHQIPGNYMRLVYGI
jgi:hypothetical protein